MTDWRSRKNRISSIANRPTRPALPTIRRAMQRTRRKRGRSEEHTSGLQSLMRISYAVFCLKKKKRKNTHEYYTEPHTELKTCEIIKQYSVSSYKIYHGL